MAKFIAHGIIVEEPSERAVGAKLTVIKSVKISERQIVGGKEMECVLSVDFIGKSAEQIPQGRLISGKVCVICGNVTSREWNGKFYLDLKGETFTLVEPKQENRYFPPNPAVQETKSGNLDQLDVADDDLPF